MSLLPLSLLTLLTVSSSLQYIKRATSTALHPSSNGINTQILVPSDVTISPILGWSINVQTQQNFHLHLSINSSYGFHPSLPSSLEITVNSDMIISDTEDLDLIFSFDVSDEYFTVMLRMDNNGNNWIFPSCNTNISSFDNMMNDDLLSNILNSTEPRYSSAANNKGTEYVEMKPIPFDAKIANINHFPLIFNIINNPISDSVIFEYHNPSMDISQYQQCGFSPSFESEYGFNLYVAGEAYDEQFSITSFDVQYIYNTTTPETMLNIFETTKQIKPNKTGKQQEMKEISSTQDLVGIIDTNKDRNIESVDNNNKTMFVLSDEMTMWLLIIPCSCVCLLCMIALCLTSQKPLKSKRNKLSTFSIASPVIHHNRNNTLDEIDRFNEHCSLQITGAIDYNLTPPKQSNINFKIYKGRKYSNYDPYLAANNNNNNNHNNIHLSIDNSLEASPSLSSKYGYKENKGNDVIIDQDINNSNKLYLQLSDNNSVSKNNYYQYKHNKNNGNNLEKPGLEMVHSMDSEEIRSIKKYGEQYKGLDLMNNNESSSHSPAPSSSPSPTPLSIDIINDDDDEDEDDDDALNGMQPGAERKRLKSPKSPRPYRRIYECGQLNNHQKQQSSFNTHLGKVMIVEAAMMDEVIHEIETDGEQ